MATNDFLPFATGTGANVISQAIYAALSAQSQGFSSGIAGSAQFNKVWRQSSFVTAMIGQFIVDNSGNNASDDGNIPTLEANFRLAIQGVTRVKAIANVNFYVNASSGNDTNTGLTTGTAFKTIQRAIDVAYNSYDYNGYGVTINLANGTYASSGVTVAKLSGQLFGTNLPLVMLGNPSSPGSVAIVGTTASCFVVSNGAVVTINGVSITSSGTGTIVSPTAGYGIIANNAAVVSVSNIVFGSCSSTQTSSSQGAVLVFGSGCVFGGTSPSALVAQSNGFVWIQSVTATVSPGATYTVGFAQALFSGVMSAVGTTFSGSASGPRYVASFNGSFNTGGGGANYFPGSTAGVVITGGQYV